MPKTVTIGNAYIALARTVSLLDDATRTRRVANFEEFDRLADNTVPPFCLWVWDGEEYGGPETMDDSGAVQETSMEWSAYVGAMSFGPEGEGAFSQAAGAAAGEDAETIAELLVEAIQGKGIYGPDANGIVSRAYPVMVKLFRIGRQAVIYRVTFRNPFVRKV